MTDLSPSAQAVLDAVDALYEEDIPEDRYIMAAAIRAAADQLMPSQQYYDKAFNEFAVNFLDGMACAADELKSIAAELGPTTENND